MSAIPISWGSSLRIVYKAKTLHHAAWLQSQLPTSLVALPADATHWDIERYALRTPMLCATAGFHYPLRSLDILQYTSCNKLLMRNILVEMDAEKKGVLGHEMVILV